jgi:hypothetical protein
LTALQRVLRPDSPVFGDNGRWILNYWAYDPASAALKRRIYDQLPPLDWKPGSRPIPHALEIDGKRWEYVVAEEDHVIDFSLFNFAPRLMQGWLFTCLKVKRPLTVEAELHTIGPARVWLNGQLKLHFAEHFSYVALQTVPLTLNLSSGLNDLYLQGDMLGWREARLALGIRFPDNPVIENCVPLGDIAPAKWQQAEAALSQVLIKQFAFPKLPGYLSLDSAGTGPVTVDAEVELPLPENVVAVVAAEAPPSGQSLLTLAPGQVAEIPITPAVAHAMASLPGENTQTLRLRSADGIPVEIEREIWASTSAFSYKPYGDYNSRRREALEHLARMPYDVPAAMATVEVGKAEYIDSNAVQVACHYLNNRYDCADFYAIGLLALLNWFGDQPALRPADRAYIEDSLRGFKYWVDEPGLDGMCYFTENHQILFHVSAYLAGQHLPHEVFTNSGLTGLQQKGRARPRIKSWIQRRLQGNFSEWDSNAYLALDVFAMLALVEFADSDSLRKMASTLLDKIFFLITCQSFRGTHGSTHGRCYVAGLKSARVENTSNLQRIAWGMGIFNGETRATSLLAMARRYRVPDVIQQIGAHMPDVLVTRARSAASYRPQFDMKSGTWDVRTITRRTPDGMLSAAIDYCPGEMGVQEHLWQATFGPEAVIFTTYPGNSQEHGNARPNFWAGSVRLPRVAMHNRTVICLYQIAPDVGLGFSHAYFPTAMFDEYRIADRWAFARAGEGYVALCSDGNLLLTTKGRHAWQELRSEGKGQAWLCHIGSAAEDGSFSTFCEIVQHSKLSIEGTGITWTTPEDTTLSFSWHEPLRVNGKAWDMTNFPHYENLYTQTSMDAQRMIIRFQRQELTLDLR